MGCSGMRRRIAAALPHRDAAALPPDRARGTCRDRAAERCFSHGSFAVALQLLLRAEAQVGLAFADQALGMLAINVETIALAIGRVGAADIGTFIPVKAQPLQVVEKLRLRSGPRCARGRCLQCAGPSCPCVWRANSQLNSAVRALPTCSCPVGEGAKRTRTFEVSAHMLMLARARRLRQLGRRSCALRRLT